MTQANIKAVIDALLGEALAREDRVEDAGLLYGITDIIGGLIGYSNYGREKLVKNLEITLSGIEGDIEGIEPSEYVGKEAVEQFYKAFYRGEAKAASIALEKLRGLEGED